MLRHIPLLPSGSLFFLCLLAALPTVAQHPMPARGCSDQQESTESAGYQRLLRVSRLGNNTEAGVRVHQTTVRVVGAAGRYFQRAGRAGEFNRYAWEINLIQQSLPGVVALPGGKIAVYSALLDSIAGDEQLAFFIAHALGHLFACHEARAGRLTPKSPALNAREMARVEYAGRPYSGFSLAEEEEADRIALFLTASAGYDPRRVLLFPGFTPDRIQRLEATLSIVQAFVVPYEAEIYPNTGAGYPDEPPHPADTLSVGQPGQEALPLPDTGYALLVQVKTVSSFKAYAAEFTVLRELGNLHTEDITVDGFPYQRILLRVPPEPAGARAVLSEVKKLGFKEAFLIEYSKGKRGKRVD